MRRWITASEALVLIEPALPDQTMKLSYCKVLLLIAFCFGMFAHNVRAAQPPFQTEELERFVKSSAAFFEWLGGSSDTEHVLKRLMGNPQFIAEFPDATRLLHTQGWEPERFAYILDHVLIAYRKLGTGGNSGSLLERLEKSRIAVQGDSTRNEAEKERVLAIVIEAQRELEKTDKAFAALPAEEVRLMWLHRAELHQALDGRLPMRKRMLPNPSR
jgi:hypothetical protein